MKIIRNKKITTKYCPKCEDGIMVETKKGEIMVFQCKNCKFKIRK